MHIPTTVRYLVRGAIIVLLAVGIGSVALWNAPESNAGGNTIISVDTTGSWTSLALDASGNPVVSYYDAVDGDLRILHCNNANCSSGNSITLPDTEGDVGTYTSLVLDSSGNPVVSYYDATNGDLKLMHCNDPDCAGGDESITSPDQEDVNGDTTSDDVGRWNSLALDGSGNPVISYRDRTNLDLKLMHCNDANCAGGDESITSPDTAGDVGFGTSLALDDAGNPVVSYGHGHPNSVKVLHCANPNCDPGNVITTFSGGTSNILGSTSLVLDSSGNPVVSYAFQQPGLMLLHCGDASCSAGNVITDNVFGARFPSLALDATGNPVVSLARPVNNSLVLLHCNDVNCAGDDESIIAPDTIGVGGYTSLALDDSGNPVVSYRGGGGLKVLHCAEPTCGAAPPETPSATPTATLSAPDTETPMPPAPATSTPVPATATPVSATATPIGLTGDVNCEGTVNSIDVALVLQFSAGLVSSLACQQNADVNGDGSINAIDASLILQFVAGLLPSL